MNERQQQSYVYYLLMRPPGPGCQPTNGLSEVEAFDMPTGIGNGLTAWGKLVYSRPLTKDEIDNYELISAFN
jgi:hypothetical protein